MANSKAIQERIGAVRRATPAALLDTHTHEISLRGEQRVDSLGSVLRSITSFVIFIIAGFMLLGEFGINLGPLIAGAGIVGVAVGFGSQTLVKDFLSGLFILIEDQFGVGDVVDLDGTMGTVVGVSLRTTRVRSIDGTLWHVPNGEISRVGNTSQHWSRALLDIDVAYDTNLDLAQDTIREAAIAQWNEDEGILEEPAVWGVQELGPNAVTIRLVVKTTPAEQFRIQRELRRRIKDRFDEQGIEIPFPQQMVWHRTEHQS
jgi:small conductance mechanosensitive channel